MPLSRARRAFISLCVLFCGLQACATEPDGRPVARGGGGVVLAANAVVYCGSPYNCTRPATIDIDKVREQTPEWQMMQVEGVRTGTARHNLLMARMHDRIVGAAGRVARARGRDLVVRAGDIRDDNGLGVTDLTEDVIGASG